MLWEAVPTALVASFSPWTLLIVAGLLSRDRPMRHALVFLASAATVTLLIGFLVVEAVGNSDLEDRRRHHSVSPAIDLGLGLAILLFAAFFARRPPRKPKDQRRREAGLLAVVALGAFVGSPSPLYLASLHSITKGRPDAATGVVYVLLIAALVLLMVEVPIILFAAAPERTTALLDSANAWLAKHGRVLGIVAALGVGCYFTITGLVHLL